MNAPILQSESGDAAAFARIQALAGTAQAQTLLRAGFNARFEDPNVAKLLSESGDIDARIQSHLLSRNRSHLMGLAPSAVHIDVGLENQFQAYGNRDMIADAVLPVVSVPKKSNKIWELPLATLQQVSNAQLAGSRGRPNDVGAYTVSSSLSYSCVDYGLVDFIDYETLANEDAPISQRVLSAMVVKSFLDLSRENRVAGVAFNSANYGTNTAALAGANRWDVASSDPIAAILAVKESIYSTPNTFVIGGQVWPLLRTHPKVLQYILSRAGVSNIGAVPALMQLEFFASLIEVDRVVVGRAKIITGQEASTTSSYLWGKSAALIRVEPNPNPKMTSCFGYTYRFGSKSYRNEVIPDRMPGLMGGEYLKLTTSDDEVCLGSAAAANPAGYLWETVIS